MPGIARFEDIQAWQEARELTRRVYEVTATGNLSRDFALRDQIRRAAVATMSSIAEGFDCDARADFARFLGVARRKIVELQSLLYVALDAGHLDQEAFAAYYAQAAKAKGLIGGFKSSLEKR